MGGNRKHAYGNAYIFPDAVRAPPPPTPKLGSKIGGFFIKPYCANSDGQVLGSSGWGESYTGNTCFIKSTDVYEFGRCKKESLRDLVPLTQNNTFYVTDGAPVFKCGGTEYSLSQWQGMGE